MKNKDKFIIAKKPRNNVKVLTNLKELVWSW